MHFTRRVPIALSVSGTRVRGQLVMSATAACLQTLKDLALPGPGDHLPTAFPVRTPSNPGLTLSGTATLSASAHLAAYLPKLPAPQKGVSYFPDASGWALELATQQNASLGFNYTFWAPGLGRAPAKVCASLDTLSKPYDTLYSYIYLYGYDITA